MRAGSALERLARSGVVLALVAAGALAPGDARGERPVTLSAGDAAWLASRGPIRVAVIETPWPPFDMLSETGVPRGITADYLDLLAARHGLRLEHVRVPTFADGLAALKRRDIDLLGSIARTPERDAFALFTAPYARSQPVIITRKDQATIRNTGGLAGKKVATERGFASQEFLRKAGLGITFVEVTTTLDALQAVAAGDADAYVGSLVTAAYLMDRSYLTNLEARASSGFPTSELRFAVRKELAPLARIVDEGLGALREADHDRIRNRWVPTRGLALPGTAVELTPAERDWIQQHRRIRLAVLGNRRPLEIVEPDGRHGGIAADYAALLRDRLGLEFVPVAVSGWSDLADRLKARDVDAVALVLPSEERSTYLAYTRPFFSMPWVLITPADAPLVHGLGEFRGRGVAVLSGNSAHGVMAAQHPEVPILPMATEDEGLAAVARGKAAAMVAPIATVGPVIQQRYASTLKVAVGLPEIPSDFSIGVRRDWTTLRDLLDKGLATISDDEHAAIRNRWLGVTYSFRLDWQQLLRVVVPIALTLGLVILVITIWNRRLRAQIVQRKRVERELADAKEVADSANRAKTSFLATMSHEIRTPMNGVLGMLELLRLTRLDAEQRATLDVARESARSLLGIIDDVLDVSKIEAGRLELRPEPTAVGAVVESVFLVYSVTASGKRLLLTRWVDPDISPALVVDPLRLRQVLNNFTSNALKFTPPEGRVEIRAERVGREAGMETVRLSVSDTGIGVSPENQTKLFQAFVQAEADTTRRFGGTGLGLAICRRLAEMMGGTIEMRSEVGAGTTMTLTVPLAIADPALVRSAGGAEPAMAERVGRRAAPAAPEAEREGTLVLVVDDHPTNRALLQRQLMALGYACEVAEQGVEALARWKAGRFGAVITDCHMPEMDGYDLTRAIRAEEAGRGAKRTPVIACTASALQGEAEACLAAGMDDYLAKPVEIAALGRALDQWLPLPERAGGAPAHAATTPAAGPPIDPAALAALTGGDRSVEREILLEYKLSNDAEIATLRGALARKDLPAIAGASERIKGASRMVGAHALAAVCERMEHAGRRGEWPSVAVEERSFLEEVARLDAHLGGS